jgi:soluble cytochrome b562
MQDLQAGAKALDKALGTEGAGDVPKALAALWQMETALVAAREHEPSKADELKDAAAQAQMLKGFRLELIGLQRTLLDVESALHEGRVEVARTLVAERVKPAKKTGHEKYKD